MRLARPRSKMETEMSFLLLRLVTVSCTKAGSIWPRLECTIIADEFMTLGWASFFKSIRSVLVEARQQTFTGSWAIIRLAGATRWVKTIPAALSLTLALFFTGSTLMPLASRASFPISGRWMRRLPTLTKLLMPNRETQLLLLLGPQSRSLETWPLIRARCQGQPVTDCNLVMIALQLRPKFMA